MGDTTEAQNGRNRRSIADDNGWQLMLVSELRRLNGQQHDRKKKDTILALIDARLAGAPEEDVWRRPDTCARSTWHDKWKKDKLIADVLARSYEVADEWRDNRVALALAETAERLALESPASLDTAVDVRDNGTNDRDRLSAAFGIMDRASSATAPKGSQQVEHSLSAEQFAQLQREARDHVEELENAAEQGWDPGGRG